MLFLNQLTFLRAEVIRSIKDSLFCKLRAVALWVIAPTRDFREHLAQKLEDTSVCISIPINVTDM